jgi:hypothetical protein
MVLHGPLTRRFDGLFIITGRPTVYGRDVEHYVLPVANFPSPSKLHAMFGKAHRSSPEDRRFSGYYFLEAAKGYDGPPRMLRLYLLIFDDPPILRCYTIKGPSVPAIQHFKSWLRRLQEQLLAAEAHGEAMDD